MLIINNVYYPLENEKNIQSHKYYNIANIFATL